MRVYLPLFSLVMAMAVTGNVAGAGCATVMTQAEAAVDQEQLDRLQPLLQELHQQADCPHHFLRDVERAMAQIAAKQAQALLQQGQSNAAMEQLKQAPRPTWETQFVYGEIAAQQRRWGKALQHYNQAFILLDDREQTPTPPSPAATAYLRKLSEEAQLLHGQLAASVSRGGGAAAWLQQRSMEPIAWPVPVQFDTDYPKPKRLHQPGFTATGRSNAELLAAFIKQRQPTRIALVGHTDERGTAAHNRGLSQRRACVLQDFLHNQGVRGEIIAIGQGEDEPLELSDDERYTQAETWALNRRVELQMEWDDDLKAQAIDCTVLGAGG